MAAQRDYYQVWGVAETATTDEIKKAFRRLAKQYHPDRSPNNPQAAERFKEINEAHDVLSDADKRKKYDQMRRYGAFSPEGGRRGRSAPQDSGNFDISDLGGLGDIFSSIFGRRGGAGREAEPEDTETEVTIPFRVAALGGAVPITLAMSEVWWQRRGKGCDDQHLPGVQRAGDGVIRAGRVRRESSLSRVPGQGHRALAALSHLSGRWRSARRKTDQRRHPGRSRGRRAHPREEPGA